jgi:hypothetical protein
VIDTKSLFKSIESTSKKFSQMSGDVKHAYIKAVRYESGKILTESLKQCPIDKSGLRNSAFTDVVITTDGVIVVMGYRSEYAVPVHEIAPTSGGRWGTGAKHNPPTKWKFLEDPWKSGMGTFVRNVGEAVKVALGRK